MKNKKLFGYSALALFLVSLSVMFFTTQVSGILEECYCFGVYWPCTACFPGDTCDDYWIVSSVCDTYGRPNACTTRWKVICLDGDEDDDPYTRYFVASVNYCLDCVEEPPEE